MKLMEMQGGVSQGCQTLNTEPLQETCKFPLLKVSLGFLKILPWGDNYLLLLLPPVKSQCCDLFSLFPQEMLTFQQKLENGAGFAPEEQPQHHRGEQELGHVLISCWESPRETVLGFMEQLTWVCTSSVFQQEPPVYFPVEHRPFSGDATAAGDDVPALPGAEGQVSTSSLTSGSPLQVLLDTTNLLL